MAAKSPTADVEAGLLAHLNSNSEIPDSRSFASSLGVPHKELEDVIKSLSAFRIVESSDITKETWVLTDEAKGYAARGSPEVQLVAAIPPEGASKGMLKEKLGDVFDIGMKTAAKNKWIGFEKGNKDLVLRKVEDIKDELQEQFKRLENGEVLVGMGFRSMRIMRVKNLNLYAFGLYIQPDSICKKLGPKYASVPVAQLKDYPDFYEDLLRENIHLN